LAEFKKTVREQYFSLILDPEAALAAIPNMLQASPGVRSKILEAIRRTVEAAGELNGERAERLAYIEKLFSATTIGRKTA
jgi:hypothetical protein